MYLAVVFAGSHQSKYATEITLRSSLLVIMQTNICASQMEISVR